MDIFQLSIDDLYLRKAVVTAQLLVGTQAKAHAQANHVSVQNLEMVDNKHIANGLNNPPLPWSLHNADPLCKRSHPSIPHVLPPILSYSQVLLGLKMSRKPSYSSNTENFQIPHLHLAVGPVGHAKLGVRPVAGVGVLQLDLGHQAQRVVDHVKGHRGRRRLEEDMLRPRDSKSKNSIIVIYFSFVCIIDVLF